MFDTHSLDTENSHLTGKLRFTSVVGKTEETKRGLDWREMVLINEHNLITVEYKMFLWAGFECQQMIYEWMHQCLICCASTLQTLILMQKVDSEYLAIFIKYI